MPRGLAGPRDSEAADSADHRSSSASRSSIDTLEHPTIRSPDPTLVTRQAPQPAPPVPRPRPRVSDGRVDRYGQGHGRTSRSPYGSESGSDRSRSTSPTNLHGVSPLLSPPPQCRVPRSSRSPVVPRSSRSPVVPPPRNIMSARLSPLDRDDGGEAPSVRPRTATSGSGSTSKGHRRTRSSGSGNIMLLTSETADSDQNEMGAALRKSTSTSTSTSKSSVHRRSRTDIDVGDVAEALSNFNSTRQAKHGLAAHGKRGPPTRPRNGASNARSATTTPEPATNVGFVATSMPSSKQSKGGSREQRQPLPPIAQHHRSAERIVATKVKHGSVSVVEAAHIAAIEAALEAEALLDRKEADAVISPTEREHITAVAAAAKDDLEHPPAPTLSLAEPEPLSSESESESEEEEPWEDEIPTWPPTTRHKKEAFRHKFDTLLYVADVSHIPIDSLISYGESFCMNHDEMGTVIPLDEFAASMQVFDPAMARWEVVLLAHVFDLIDSTGFWPVPRNYQLYSIVGEHERSMAIRDHHGYADTFSSLDDGYDNDLMNALSVFKSLFHIADKTKTGIVPQKALLRAVSLCKAVPAEVMPQVVEVIKGAITGEEPLKNLTVLDYLAVCPAACAFLVRIDSPSFAAKLQSSKTSVAS